MSDRILICRRTAYGDSSVPSIVERCYLCGERVWVAASSPEHEKVACTVCAAGNIPEEGKMETPTAKQMEEIAPAIEAFRAVGRGDLEQIEGLAPVIERLLDSLRELRRENPEKFFGQPQERLYESLEAALSSFYCSRVSGQRPPDQNAS